MKSILSVTLLIALFSVRSKSSKGNLPANANYIPAEAFAVASLGDVFHVNNNISK